MPGNPVYVLIHSPLVGGLTWTPVADQLRQRGLEALIPVLNDSPGSKEPYWKQHAESVALALTAIPPNDKLILVAHSGAGPLLPAIRQRLLHLVRAYVFVDAGIPRAGATRLDLMKSEDLEWAKKFEESLQRGDRFPTWSSNDLREIVPDEDLREKLVAELRPRGLDFFSEPIPVFAGWPDAACVYILFSPPYASTEIQARQAGWKTYKLQAGHFHMLVDAKAVADIIIQSVREIDG